MLSSSDEGSESDEALCTGERSDYIMYNAVWGSLLNLEYQSSLGEINADGTVGSTHAKGNGAALVPCCIKIRSRMEEVSSFGEFMLEARWPVTDEYTPGTKVWLSRTHPERDALAHPFVIVSKARDGSRCFCENTVCARKRRF